MPNRYQLELQDTKTRVHPCYHCLTRRVSLDAYKTEVQFLGKTGYL